MRRQPVALGLSLAAHVALIATVAITARTHANAGPRTIQLNGTPQERQAGRDVLFDVLRGDGMPIRLGSTSDETAVGLAWWSPDVGLWLAVDRLPPHLAGARLHVTLRVGVAEPIPVGRMVIDDDGSGRIVASWTAERPAAGTPVALHVSDPQSSWSWTRSMTLLTGGAPMRQRGRASE